MLDLFLVHGVDPGIARLKVSELFSPPRVAEQLRVLPDFASFEPGSTFDLRADRNGRCWDFLRADHRKEVRRRIAEERPYLAVGSPPCADFSVLFRGLCAPRMHPEEVKKRRVKAELLLRFSAEIYQSQLARGDHFLHEHPAVADSWSVPCIRRLREDPRVGEVTAHQCMFGQTTSAADGTARPARKATRFLSSAPCILDELGVKCSGDHEHQHLIGGRAAQAAVYPPELCRAILRGLERQRLREGRGFSGPALRALHHGTGLYDLAEGAYDLPMTVDAEVVQNRVRDEEEELVEHSGLGEKIFDELTGEDLPEHPVRSAREEECSFMEQWGV
jgi:hypothetical protein